MTGGSGLSAPRREGTVTGGWPALGERGCCGERAECGPREEENGPRFGVGSGRREGRELGLAGEGKSGPGWAQVEGWAAIGFLLSYFYFFSFSISNQTNLGEIKFKFEFTTSTQTTKAMHQHECINKVLTLDKILIT